MRKVTSVLAVCALVMGCAGLSFAADSAKKKAVKKSKKPAVVAQEEKAAPVQNGFAPYVVYSDKADARMKFLPTGWMGDYGDVKVIMGCSDVKYNGADSIKVVYTGEAKNNAGWAGVYWQYPGNNWGKVKGMDLTGAKELSFWARGEKGGEVVSEFKMGGITGEFSDSDSRQIGPIVLTNEWQQYTVDLTGADLSNVIGGFCWAASKENNPEGFIVYIDEIFYK